LRRASPFFSKKILKGGIVEHRISQKQFQARVLVLVALQPLCPADVHAAILGFPPVNGGIADPVRAAQIGDGNPGLVLFQDADDLIFGEPAALHLWSFRLDQSLPQTGLGRGSNVTLTSGLTRKRVAADLGVGMSTLNKRITAQRDTDVVLNEDLSLVQENDRLRRENRILKEERGIPKRATQFFARQKP
jgi:transposase